MRESGSARLLTEQSNDDDSPSVYTAEAETLLAAALQGDAHHAGELLDRYRNYLMLIALTQIEGRLRPRVSPSDVVQETMLKAVRNFRRFRGRSEKELLAWLRQILANNLADCIQQHMGAAKRDVRREISLEQLDARLENSTVQLKSLLSDQVDTPSIAVQQREEAVLLADRLADLPDQYREVLVMRHIQGLSFEEVATRIDRSLGAARMLWLRAIEKLRAQYRREQRDAT